MEWIYQELNDQLATQTHRGPNRAFVRLQAARYLSDHSSWCERETMPRVEQAALVQAAIDYAKRL